MKRWVSILERTDILVLQSSGRSKSGLPIYYVKPKDCHNKAKRCEGMEKLKFIISKWFEGDIRYYQMGRWKIGATNPGNAVKEWKRLASKDELSHVPEMIDIN